MICSVALKKGDVDLLSSCTEDDEQYYPHNVIMESLLKAFCYGGGRTSNKELQLIQSFRLASNKHKEEKCHVRRIHK